MNLEVVLLDSGPLGFLAHPKPRHEIMARLTRLVASGVEVLVPEIADYEVRRELLLRRRFQSVRRLDELKEQIGFLPITTHAMIRAAEFWASARKGGLPTDHEHALDGDVILAGQAVTYASKGLVVATTNPRHLSRFVPARHWEDINP